MTIPFAAPAPLPQSAFTPAPAASSRDYWLCQATGWALLGMISVMSSGQGALGPMWRMTVVKLLVICNGLLLSHCWRLFLRRRGWIDRGDPPVPRVLLGLIALSAVQVGFLVGADILIRKGALIADSDATAVVIALCVLWYAVFLMWTLMYAVVLSRRRARRFELEKLELEVSVKDAELRALQAQVNPHFFFNSMNSIRALIYQDPDTAAQAVGQLAGLMRHSLRAGQSPTVRLADEVAAVNAYLAIERHRFDERLQAEVGIAPGLDEVQIPPMALQTLVENAVKHGVEPAIGACRVRVSAVRQDGQVLLTVANQGRLQAASASTRLGLANTARRLALLFGPRAGCTLREEGGWVVAQVVLPQEPDGRAPAQAAAPQDGEGSACAR
jgi:signal transduction histidine kinase